MFCDKNGLENKYPKNIISEYQHSNQFQTLQLVKLAKFNNNQVNGIFNDNTTIIINPGFEFLTYFHSDNKKLRIKTENLLKNHKIYLKVHLILNIFNLFSTQTIRDNFIRLYYKSIISSQNESDLIFTSFDLITKSYWIYEDSYFESDSFTFSIKSLDELTKFYLFKNKRIIKIQYPHLIPDESTKDGNYIYIKMEKFYKIDYLPKTWRIPLIILIKYFNLESLIQTSLSQEEIMFAQTIQKSKEFYNTLFIFEENSKKMESDQIIETDIKTSKLSDDEINPIAFIFNNKTGLDFLYSRNFTYLIHHTENENLNCEIISNEFPYLTNYTSNQMSILNYQFSYDDVIKSVETEKYLQLFNSESDISNNPYLNSDYLIEIIFELNEIKKYCKNSYVEQNLNKNNLKERIFSDPDKNSFVFDGNEVLHYKIIKDIGEFYAFKNKAIKVKFYDRTIMKLDSKLEKIWILNRYGHNFIFPLKNLDESFKDYLNYYENVAKFYNDCFLSYNEKTMIKERLKIFEELSDSSLRRISAMKIICEYEKIKSNIVNNQGKQKNNKFIEYPSEILPHKKSSSYYLSYDVNELDETKIEK